MQCFISILQLIFRLQITPAQLAQHDKETDAWLAIRGKVYNVTAYFPFHPGGPEELKKGIGKDATTLFDQVRSYLIAHVISKPLTREHIKF